MVAGVDGCARARFTPLEPINSANAGRLERVYSRKFGHPTLLESVLGGRAITNAAVDGDRHILYVHWYRHPGLLNYFGIFLPVEIDAIVEVEN